MKKRIILTLVILVSIGFGILIGTNFNNEKTYTEDKPKQIKNENTLSMMLEQTTGAGDYVKTEASSWPTDGYLFNSTLSKCENGGEVAWDSDNNTVLMMGNTSDKCYIYFDKYSVIKINNYSITSSANSIIITINANSGTGAISKYYYSKDGGATYIDSSNNTYTFSGLSKGTYNIKAYVMDSNNKSSSTISKSIEITTIPFATYIKSLYTGVQGENSLYHHDGTLTNGIDDNSYRYAGASSSVNNYVCISSETTCSDANLYRIIGVFGEQVKLIKATLLVSMAWDSNTSNTWSTASLNTYLNGTYLTSLGGFADKIAVATWKVGGTTESNIQERVPSVAYQNEIVNPATNTTDNKTEYSAKIGLMYASDYGFAAAPGAWTLKMGYYSDSSATSSNWMYTGLNEWTITRCSGYSYRMFFVYYNGNVYHDYNNHDGEDVRPAFYLNSSVTYLEGTGTSSDPFRIS